MTPIRRNGGLEPHPVSVQAFSIKTEAISAANSNPGPAALPLVWFEQVGGRAASRKTKLKPMLVASFAGEDMVGVADGRSKPPRR